MWRRRFARFGLRSVIMRPAMLYNAKLIEIGAHVEIRPFARLEAILTGEDGIRLRIGNGCVIHSNVHIGAAESVSVGEGVLIASRVYITDHDHDFSDPSVPPIKNRRLLTAPVEIGDYAWLGEGAMVLKGVTIGRHSVIGAGAVVTSTIPPYSVAVGVPARVIRAYSQEKCAWLST